MTPPITVHRSFSDGNVSISIRLRASNYGDASIKIEANTDLTTAQARTLAQELTAAADQADAKVAAKAAAAERRQKWRDREVASGRMKVLSAREFFRGS